MNKIYYFSVQWCNLQVHVEVELSRIFCGLIYKCLHTHWKTFVQYTHTVSQSNITIIGFLLARWTIFQRFHNMNCFREHFHKCLRRQPFDVVGHKYTQRSMCRSKVYQRIQIFVYTVLFHYSLYLTAAFYCLRCSSLLTQYHLSQGEQCCFLYQ